MLLQYDEQTPLQSLFEGEPARELAAVAPYLAQFKNPDHPLLKELVYQGWGNNWGVYFDYPGDFTTARHHLRQFIRVKTLDGEYRMFRFFDPRAFRKMLPSMDISQLIPFYSAIGSYWLEDKNPRLLLRYYLRDLQLTTDSIDLETGTENTTTHPSHAHS